MRGLDGLTHKTGLRHGTSQKNRREVGTGYSIPDSPTAEDSDGESRLPLAIEFNRPDMQMFHNQGGISILYIIEAIGLRSGNFSDNRHPRSFDQRGRVQKLLLQREKPSLRLLAIEGRLFSVLERKLQELDLRAAAESLRFQNLATKHEHTPLIEFR